MKKINIDENIPLAIFSGFIIPFLPIFGIVINYMFFTSNQNYYKRRVYMEYIISFIIHVIMFYIFLIKE